MRQNLRCGKIWRRRQVKRKGKKKEARNLGIVRTIEQFKLRKD